MSILSYATGIQHIGIPTADMAKTLAFYQDLGFEIAWQTQNKKVAFLKFANVVIETYESPAAAGHPGAIEHIALDVTDVDAAYAVAKEKGY
ncbi:MAG: VOC family protein, partial [Eubacteriales bacterium]|nr:VOC family protein [Eubacteriales bacterium]